MSRIHGHLAYVGRQALYGPELPGIPEVCGPLAGNVDHEGPIAIVYLPRPSASFLICQGTLDAALVVLPYAKAHAVRAKPHLVGYILERLLGIAQKQYASPRHHLGLGGAHAREACELVSLLIAQAHIAQAHGALRPRHRVTPSISSHPMGVYHEMH